MMQGGDLVPFQSGKQRRWMFKNKPAMAKRWAAEGKRRKRRAKSRRGRKR